MRRRRAGSPRRGLSFLIAGNDVSGYIKTLRGDRAFAAHLLIWKDLCAEQNPGAERKLLSKNNENYY